MNIGQAARRSGLSAKMLRYYESIGLLAATSRGENGYRHYSDEDLQALAFIRRARELGFSLTEIGRLLSLWQDRDRASAEVKALAQAHLDELDRKLEEMSRLRETLADLVAGCRGDQQPDCAILDALQPPSS